ncbi:MAG: MFS transporter [Oscillospiraceae bacterium]
MLLINGVIYAWSIYSSPFVEGFGWSSAKLGVCFTVMLGSFCLGGVIGGAVANWRGVRVSVPAGGVLGFVGYLLCMFLQADRLWLLFIAFAIAGIGVGFVYNGVLSAVVPRFPDKKGLASGVLLMGFGASSLVLGSLASGSSPLPASAGTSPISSPARCCSPPHSSACPSSCRRGSTATPTPPPPPAG